MNSDAKALSTIVFTGTGSHCAIQRKASILSLSTSTFVIEFPPALSALCILSICSFVMLFKPYYARAFVGEPSSLVNIFILEDKRKRVKIKNMKIEAKSCAILLVTINSSYYMIGTYDGNI
jgi:hypothetical protein